jgi:hypothetical protein
MSLQAPPARTVPRHNVYIRVPHLRHCIIHGVDKCKRNDAFYRDIQRWAEIAPGRVYIWDYTVNFEENFLLPFPVIRAISDSIKCYARLGLAGMTLQGNYVSTGGDLVVLKNYVWRHLLWDPDRDVDALIREFCDGYYGPAADAMVAYLAAIESPVNGQQAFHTSEFTKLAECRKYFYPPERMKVLRAHLETARAAAVDRPPYDRRVAEAAVSLDATGLFHFKPMVPGDGRLCMQRRAGLDYTYDRATRMLANCRQSSFREWRAFRSYHQPFLSKHGGPLVTLAAGDLSVDVAPALSLQIYQIRFRGTPLLRAVADPAADGFPFVGGAFEDTNPHWRHGGVHGEPGPAALTMKSTIESGSSVKAFAEKDVRIVDGVVHIDARMRTRKRRPGYEHVRCMNAGVVYDIGRRKRAAFEAAVQLTDGSWQDVAFPAQLAVRPAKYRKDRETGERVVIRKAISTPAEVSYKNKTVAALRVRLPNVGVQVIERYREPGVGIRDVTLALDTFAGTLQTTVGTRARGLDERKMTNWLHRELVITPLPE